MGVPEMALLPGDCVENCGHHKEATEAKAINPSRYGLPVIIGQEVEVGAAEDAGNDPELEGEKTEQGQPFFKKIDIFHKEAF